MSGSSAPPPAPSPYVVAGAQSAANIDAARETAALNRLNEITPYGSVSYQSSGNAAAPYSRVISLNPAEQRLLDTQRGTEQKLADTTTQVIDRVAPDLATPFSLEGLPNAPIANADERQRIEAALMERMRPSLDQQRNQLQTRLSNMGFDVNSEGYRNALDEANRTENDARLAVIGQGGNEMSRLFGLEQSARQQALQEAVLQRNQPLNEIAALLGTGQVTSPQFGAVPQVGVAPADLTGGFAQQYQGQLSAYNQNQANRQATTSGLFGLGASALGAGLGEGGFLNNWLN